MITIIFNNFPLIFDIDNVADNSLKSPISVKSILIIWPIIRKWPITFFDKFPPNSSFATKRLSLWKEWTYFTIQDVQRVLLCNFVHCFYRRFHVRLGYEPLSFLFLEQCFQLNLLDLFNPQMYFFDTDNLPMTWKMLIYSLSIICSIISPTLMHRWLKKIATWASVW